MGEPASQRGSGLEYNGKERFVSACRWLAVAVTVGVAMAVPTSASAQAPAQDSVVGSAVLDGVPVVIDVHSGPSGENPTGNVDITFGCLPNGLCSTHNIDLGGTATCLNVHGNRAVIGYYGALHDTLTSLIRQRGLVEVV